MIDTKSQLALPYLFKKKRIKALPLDWKCHFYLALNAQKCVDSSGFLRVLWLSFFLCQHHTLHTLQTLTLRQTWKNLTVTLFQKHFCLTHDVFHMNFGISLMSFTKKKKNPPYWDFDWDCHWTYINLKRMKFSGYWIFPLLNVTFLSINCEDLLCFSERVYDIQHLNPLIFC